MLGIIAILFGAIELFGGFSARHATKQWEKYKQELT
jgi:uncharacterized membrane protein HdeD (DUF308 family)